MLFSQDKNKKQNSEKKRSIFGLLFNPRLDRDIAPIKENAGMFVQMLASLFVTVGLFPKDHPGFTDSKRSLTMRQVIGTAYSNLKFTKEGLPQVLYFAAVVGMLGFSALFLITLLLSFMTGTAHAQSIFEPPSGTNDWGIAWIDFLFLGEKPAAGNTTVPILATTEIQKALGSALSFYSSAVLVLAGLLLLYHLIFMIAETAHTGKPMGRANQVWAPIRLVIAIGLLVPIASSGSGVTGYNTGQYLGMQVARWGSGLASNIWEKFSNSLSDMQQIGCNTPSDMNPSCLAVTDDSVKIIRGLMEISACTYFLKYQFDKGELEYEVDTLSNATTTVGAHYLGLKETNPSMVWDATGMMNEAATSFSGESVVSICGGYIIPKKPEGEYGSVHEAIIKAFANAKDNVDSYIAANYINLVRHGGNFKQIDNLNSSYNDLLSNFKTEFSDGIRTAMSTEDKNVNSNLFGKWDQYKETGWLSAGTWFNSIISTSAKRADAVYNSLPTLSLPSLSNHTTEFKNLKTVYDSAKADLDVFNGVMTNETKKLYKNNGTFASEQEGSVNFESIKAISKSSNIIDSILGFFLKLGAKAELWSMDEGTLLVNFGVTHNPLAELASFGHKYIRLGVNGYGVASVALLVGAGSKSLEKVSFGVFGGLSMISGWIASIALFLSGIFIVIGFTLAYVVPLFPFFRFFFASLTWIMSIFEMIVAMPLFALAHVNPYGEGMSGDKAKYGYNVLFQILLRPALMILGLVAGYLLFSITLFFLNYAFILVTTGIIGSTGALPMLSHIIFSILYCVTALILANECFSTIGLFPQVALSWIGSAQVKEETFGSPSAKIATAAGYLSTQAQGQLKGLAESPAKTMGESLAKKKEKTNADADDKYKQDMLNAIRNRPEQE